ncbi:hypothetical protein EDC04DRAFT_2845416 [Pisolithus marmoratus]|nr:hypothetical protein EDC04DRAFT_2845416 [Pisolithus marmoratus]
MQYLVAVFDTAPTGHNFPFLSFPTHPRKGSQHAQQSAVPVPRQTSMMGGQQNSQGDMFASIVINGVNTQFQDPVRRSSTLHLGDNATFVCGAVSEFLSLCETKRLV